MVWGKYGYRKLIPSIQFMKENKGVDTGLFADVEP